MAAVSPYSTAVSLGRPAPNYTPNQKDADRVRSYTTYSDIYTNVPEAFAAILREEDDEKSRRYIPTARSIIEATNRFLAQGLEWSATIPADVTLSEDDRDLQMFELQKLFTREEFMAKFLALKRWMLIKGDGMLHISADPLKAQGTRIRITEILPEQYFPIFDAIDAEQKIGCYIITVLENNGVTVSQRLEYRRILNQDMASEFGGPIGSIFFKLGFYEVNGWDDRMPLSAEDLKPVPFPDWMTPSDGTDAQMEGGVLPAQITAIPVYHFRNRRRGVEPFGVSELQGIETVLAGIIQNASDEDTAVALMGIGVYTTDSGRPRNALGEEVPWEIAPASVIELMPEGNFDRVPGVTSVQPILDHINMLKGESREVTGTPDVAIGQVDVAVAQSGIALAIQMSPVTAKNAETEVELKAKLDQFLYDLLNGWLPAYEGQPATGLVVTAIFGDPLPVNRKEIIEEIVALVQAKIIDAQFATEYLSEKLGFKFPADMITRMAAAAQAELDAVGARMDGVLAGDGA